MPHLIETYALNCGLKIDKPYIYQRFFPLNAEKFITIHPNSKYQSKCYDYWQETVDAILPELSKNNISIVQIGTKEDQPIRGCLHTQGQTSINQASYIIGKGLLHLGADSFATHVASALGKKIVALYSNNFAKVVRPYWTKDSDGALFEPDRSIKKPGFSEEENPKSINEIKPEDIAKSVLSLLGLNSEINWKTIMRGPKYNLANIQSVPNSVVNPKALGIESLIMRMDIEHNEYILSRQLSVCDCSVVCNKPIDLKLLESFRGKIRQFVYELDEKHDPIFASKVKRLGIDLILLNTLEEREANEFKSDYFDIGVIINKAKICSSDIERLKELDLKALYYKSKKFTISQGKIYPSIAGSRFEQPLSSLTTESRQVIDDKAFWEDIEDFYIFQKLD